MTKYNDEGLPVLTMVPEIPTDWQVPTKLGSAIAEALTDYPDKDEIKIVTQFITDSIADNLNRIHHVLEFMQEGVSRKTVTWGHFVIARKEVLDLSDDVLIYLTQKTIPLEERLNFRYMLNIKYFIAQLRDKFINFDPQFYLVT